MLKPVLFEIGPYRMLLPGQTKLSANVVTPAAHAIRISWTNWTAIIGRFQILMHPKSARKLEGLKSYIDGSTRKCVTPTALLINGIEGVTYGDYGPPRTWIDWWFRKGDTTLCLCLQSMEFPMAAPTQDEIDLHREIISSLKYAPDYPTEAPPRPET